MHCKHSGFSVTWSLGSGSQADRPPPTPTSIPGETKALTSSSSPQARGRGTPNCYPLSMT